MQVAVRIAKLAAPVLVTIGIGMLVNTSLYTAMVAAAVNVPALIFLSGLLALTAGVAMLNGYHAWTSDWRVIVTVLGWLFVIAGLIRIVLPTVAMSIARTIYSDPAAIAVAGTVVLAIGVLLGIKGYRQKV